MIREKKKKLNELIKECDIVFSIYIRLRDCDEKGTITCPTCESRNYWRDSDCAHLISRANINTRFDELNCVGACVECNRYNAIEHVEKLEKYLIAIHGQFVVDELYRRGRSTVKMMPFEIEELIESYKQAIKNLGKKHLQ